MNGFHARVVAAVQHALGFKLTPDVGVARRGFQQREAQGRKRRARAHSTTTGMPRLLAMRPFHSAGPVVCTDSPRESTATVTGMSLTSKA